MLLLHVLSAVAEINLLLLLHSLSQESSLPNSAGYRVESTVSFPVGSSEARPALVHFERKITLPMTVHLHALSSVIGPAIYRYGASQNRSGRMVLRRPRKCWYGLPYHAVPLSALVETAYTLYYTVNNVTDSISFCCNVLCFGLLLGYK